MVPTGVPCIIIKLKPMTGLHPNDAAAVVLTPISKSGAAGAYTTRINRGGYNYLVVSGLAQLQKQLIPPCAAGSHFAHALKHL